MTNGLLTSANQTSISLFPKPSGNASARRPGSPLKVSPSAGNAYGTCRTGMMIGETSIPAETKTGAYWKTPIPRSASHETAPTDGPTGSRSRHSRLFPPGPGLLAHAGLRRSHSALPSTPALATHDTGGAGKRRADQGARFDRLQLQESAGRLRFSQGWSTHVVSDIQNF